MKRISVLLIDDHAVMRMGLASLLGTCRELEVVGDAGDGEDGIRKALRLRPDVVIMDLLMPEMDGTETTRQLLAKWPRARVLVLTTLGTSDAFARALDAGACGAILKSSDLAELRKAIATVAVGKRYVSEEIEQIMTEDPPIAELSARQTQILQAICRGLSNADIARLLGISVPVVKEHLNVLFSKIGAANRTEAVAIALKRQLLEIRSQQI